MRIASCPITREIHSWYVGPILLLVALMIPINRTQHARPRTLDHKKATDVVRYRLSLFIDNIDINAKMKRGSELGLHCECVCVDCSGYLPVDVNGFAMIIEDDNEAKQVTQRMLDAGVPVVQSHVD